MKTKSLLGSKTFWLNVIGLALTVGQILPQKIAIPVIAIANIANRFLTDSSISSILPVSDDK